jgi:arylesterase/paraoxonase
MRIVRVLFYTLGAILLIGVVFTARLLWIAGSFKSIQPHFEGIIQKIDTHPGTEDITIDQQKGVAFISADDRRDSTRKGKIYVYDLQAEKPVLVDLTANFREDFHPHGISLYKTTEEKTLLFVVNHRRLPQKRHTIELFELVDVALVHLKTFENPDLLTAPNDIVAVSETQFYVSNDHYYPQKGFYRAVEEYGQMPWAFVNYYDGKQFRKVAQNIAYANGINVSKDGKEVYVASCTGKAILVFERNKFSGDLTKKKTIGLETTPDNLEVDTEGNLWSGCHPQMLAFVSHGKNPNSPSPSQVIKVNPQTGEWKEVFLNDGKDFSGSSAAAVYQNKLLIGAVFAPAFLIGEMRK